MLNFSKHFAVALVSIGLLSHSAIGQTSPQPPLEAYGSLPSTEDIALSPDGKIVALIVRQGENTGVVKVDLESGASDAVGLIGKMKSRSLHFINSDTLIVKMSKTKRTYGYRGKFEASGAVAINMDTGKVTGLLSNTENLHPAQSGLGRVIGYNPDSDEIYMPAYMKGGGRALKSYRQNGGPPVYNVLKVSPKTGKGKRHARASEHTVDWLLAPDGTVLAREDIHEDRNVYRLYTEISGKLEKILELENEAYAPFNIVGVMPDQSGLVIAADDQAMDALEKLDWSGNRSPLDVGGPNKNIDSIFRDDNRTVEGVRYSGALPRYYFFDQDLNADVEAITKRFGSSSVEIYSHDRVWNRIVYKIFDGTSSGSFLLHDRSDGSLKRLGDAYKNIPTEAIGEISVVEYKATDGTPIEALITWPAGSSEETRKNLPTIVMPHGGPASYDWVRFDWMAQYFANRGYTVFQPNFRGSDGYGKVFREAGYGQWGTGMQDDITDGLDVLINSGFTDPERVCIVGSSYGGYAALAGGAFTPDKYACVAAIAPVSDLRGFSNWVASQYGKNHSAVDYWKESIGDPKSDRGKLENASPTNSADAFTAPVLLLHGDDDTIVPITQSFVMRKALKSAGKSVKLVELDGGDHWLAERETRIQALTELDKFISEHLN